MARVRLIWQGGYYKHAVVLLVGGSFGSYILLALNACGFYQGDEVEYLQMAWSLLKGQGFWGLDIRSYFYPLILALVGYPFSDSPDNFVMMARILSVCFTTLCVYLTFLLGGSMWDERTGLVASVLTASSPVLLMFGFRPFNDFVAEGFCLLAIYLFHKGLCDHSFSWASVSSVIMSFSVMCRYGQAVFALAVILYGLFLRRRRLTVLYTAVLCVSTVAIQGFIDYFSWGTFLSSPIKFIAYNFSPEAGAAFGRPPPYFYLFAGVCIVTSILTMIEERKPRVLFMGSCVILYFVGYGSASHWEPRFIIGVLPFLYLLLVHILTHFDDYLALAIKLRKKAFPRHVSRKVITRLLVVIVLIQLFISGVLYLDFYSKGSRYNAQFVYAVNYVAKQSDANSVGSPGVLVGWHIYLPYKIELLDIQLEWIGDKQRMDAVLGRVNYLILTRNDVDQIQDLIEKYGFSVTQEFDPVLVLRKPYQRAG